jgi:hypothetical protein
LRLQPPPVESGILESSNRDELATALGVRFMELRHAMLTMSADGKEGEKQREWLAKVGWGKIKNIPLKMTKPFYSSNLQCGGFGPIFIVRPAKSRLKCVPPSHPPIVGRVKMIFIQA